MVFSSGIFLFWFLPSVLILYHAIPGIKSKNALLIMASLLFYAFGEPIYVFLMIASTLMNYLFGRMIAVKKDIVRKAGIVLAIAANILVLMVFKYSSFLVKNINSAMGTHFNIPSIVLPVGISFFTFQALSYVIDIYRKPEMCQKNYFKVLLYICFFPQLVAGPIVKYGDINREIEKRKAGFNDIAEGIRRFIFGLGKKMLVANTMGTVCDRCFGFDYSKYNFLVAWMAAVTYSIQIYYDFSGYSDMAVGLARMFGFHLKENFNYPYTAQSVKDFWSRWHISLSSWFRDYLYIPLGGNRATKFRTGINKLIVFFITGLWHGANWTFVVWGMIHGIFSLFESYGIIPAGKMEKTWLGHIYAMFVVVVSFVVFRADTLGDAVFIIGQMFFGFSMTGNAAIGTRYFISMLTPYFIVIFIISIIFSVPAAEKISKWKILQKNSRYIYCSYILSIAILVLCILNLSSQSYNPFIYFQF